MPSLLRRRGSRVCTAALLPLWLCAVRGEAQAPEPDSTPFSIAVDVNLVTLQASVHDRQSRDVANLAQQNFALYEDGVRQTIRMFRREDVPVTVGLVVDHSGSMREKLNEVLLAASTFAESSNPMDDIFVVNFNEDVFYGLNGASQFTDKPQELRDAIGRGPVTGQTALYDAIAAALEKLGAGHWEKKVLVVISDGGDNASKHTLADITAMAERSNAVIYTIGIYSDNDAEAKPGVLRRLAETTGGESFFPKQLTELTPISAHIAHDIRNQYMLGYVSTNMKQDGTHRNIRLVAEAPGSAGKLRVRTRKGYIAQAGAK
jgi:Ca-activated chloride channel family protein